MEKFDVTAEKTSLHFVEADTKLRAELVRAGTSIGCHCEIYSDEQELATYSPRSGIIFVRDRVESGGIGGVLDRLLDFGVWLPVVAMDVDSSPARIVQAVKAGALDYLILPLSAEQLANCLVRIGPEAERVCEARRHMLHIDEKLTVLSKRERQVFEAILTGETNKEIAKRLQVGTRTVETHRAKMMSKLKLRRASDAIKLRMEKGGEK